MDLLTSYWTMVVAFVTPYWEAAVAHVAGVPAAVLLAWYAPGLVLLGFVLGFLIRSAISRRRHKRARRLREGW